MSLRSDESYIKMGVKKSASVRFAPDPIASTPSTPVSRADGGNTDLSDFRAELYNCLPSNTLYRGRHRKIFSAQDTKAFTLPRSSNEYPTSFTRLRRIASVPKRKKSFRSPTDEYVCSTDSAVEVLEAAKELQICMTDEEKAEELLNLKSIPITMKEKRLYRDALHYTLKSPGHPPTSWRRDVFKRIHAFKNYFSRFKLWNGTLRLIEGQFGTGVVSYFVLLRWLIFLNTLTFLIYFLLTILPHSVFNYLPPKNISVAPQVSVFEGNIPDFALNESTNFDVKNKKPADLSLGIDSGVLENLGSLLDDYVPDKIVDLTLHTTKRNFTTAERHSLSLYCKNVYELSRQNYSSGFLSAIQDLLQGTGWMESTVLFLGFYPGEDLSYFSFAYSMPVAFLSAFLLSFLLCLIMMLHYSSHGIEENLLMMTSKFFIYTNILFSSWDCCIHSKKSAEVRHKNIIREIKSNLTEENRKIEIKQWSDAKKAKVYAARIFINILVLLSLLGCYYLIYRVVDFQLLEKRRQSLSATGIYTMFVQFLSPLVISGLNIIMPIIFYQVVAFETYSMQTEINVSLFRTGFLRLSSVCVLVFSLHNQITCEPKDKCRVGLSKHCQSPICWETYVGQQLYKLVITDFFVYICLFVGYDLPRDFIVRKCKNKVTDLIGRQTFDLPTQVLSLVYSQTLCWLGVFYSPFLPAITVLKFVILFYMKKIMVLKYCNPSPIAYKASRSNSMFMMVLTLSFFAVAVIQGYSLSSIEPSPSCSPFRYYDIIVRAIPDTLYWMPKLTHFLTFLFSEFFFVPAFFLLSFAIYYYWTVVVSHKKMSNLLEAQIVLESQDKQFLLNRLIEAAKQMQTVDND